MRLLLFMPVTFIAGQHGFALFAPYLAVFLTAATLTRGWQKRPAVPTVLEPSTDALAALST